MEKTMTMGAFEVLDQQEMLEVEGGASGEIFWIVAGWAICKALDCLWDNREQIQGYTFLCR